MAQQLGVEVDEFERKYMHHVGIRKSLIILQRRLRVLRRRETEVRATRRAASMSHLPPLLAFERPLAGGLRERTARSARRRRGKGHFVPANESCTRCKSSKYHLHHTVFPF